MPRHKTSTVLKPETVKISLKMSWSILIDVKLKRLTVDICRLHGKSIRQTFEAYALYIVRSWAEKGDPDENQQASSWGLQKSMMPVSKHAAWSLMRPPQWFGMIWHNRTDTVNYNRFSEREKKNKHQSSKTIQDAYHVYKHLSFNRWQWEACWDTMQH